MPKPPTRADLERTIAELRRQLAKTTELLHVERCHGAARLNALEESPERGLWLAPVRYVPGYTARRGDGPTRLELSRNAKPGTRAHLYAICPLCLQVIAAPPEDAEEHTIAGRRGFYLYHRECDAFAPVSYVDTLPQWRLPAIAAGNTLTTEVL